MYVRQWRHRTLVLYSTCAIDFESVPVASSAPPTPPQMSLSPHSETDWSRIRRWIVCNFQMLTISAVKFCKRCLQSASAAWALPQTLYRGFAPGLHWGPVPPLVSTWDMHNGRLSQTHTALLRHRTWLRYQWNEHQASCLELIIDLSKINLLLPSVSAKQQKHHQLWSPQILRTIDWWCPTDRPDLIDSLAVSLLCSSVILL